jgi:hypothetical protein
MSVQTNAGDFPGNNDIPLGAYGITTPWGLLDASGGAAEWTEELATGTGGIIGREYLPSYIDLPNSALPIADSVWAIADLPPNLGVGITSFRIASSIPAPGAWCAFVLPLLMTSRRRHTA